MMSSLLIIGGAILGNMLLIFGLLMRPRNEEMLWAGLLAYAIASAAWLAGRFGKRERGDG